MPELKQVFGRGPADELTNQESAHRDDALAVALSRGGTRRPDKASRPGHPYTDDPRTTRRYDRARHRFDGHGTSVPAGRHTSEPPQS